MKTKKQAEVLRCCLEIGLIGGSVVINWVDNIIAQSAEVEDWMLDISSHSPSDIEGLSRLLGEYIDFYFIYLNFEFLINCRVTSQLVKSVLFQCIKLAHSKFYL